MKKLLSLIGQVFALVGAVVMIYPDLAPEMEFTGEFLEQTDKGPVTRKMFPFDDVIMTDWLHSSIVRGPDTPLMHHPITISNYIFQKA